MAVAFLQRKQAAQASPKDPLEQILQAAQLANTVIQGTKGVYDIKKTSQELDTGKIAQARAEDTQAGVLTSSDLLDKGEKYATTTAEDPMARKFQVRQNGELADVFLKPRGEKLAGGLTDEQLLNATANGTKLVPPGTAGAIATTLQSNGKQVYLLPPADGGIKKQKDKIELETATLNLATKKNEPALKAQEEEKKTSEASKATKVEGFELSQDYKPAQSDVSKFKDAVTIKKDIDGLVDNIVNIMNEPTMGGLSTRGTEYFGAAADKMEAYRKGIALKLNKIAELGALSGGDLDLIYSQVADPNTWTSTASTIKDRLESLKSGLNTAILNKGSTLGYQPTTKEVEDKYKKLSGLSQENKDALNAAVDAELKKRTSKTVSK